MQQLLEVVPWATLIVVVIVVVGAVQVLTGALTFEEYLKLIDVPVAGLAVGRGIAAR
jgi:type IV secretory pathway VirB2 component (pilin)